MKQTSMTIRAGTIRRAPRSDGRIVGAAAALVVAMVVACSGTSPASVAPATSRSAAPSGVAGPAVPSSDAGGPSPSATPWPRDVVFALGALGGGDAEIAKAVADLSEAVANEDLVRMRGGAIGLENLIDGLEKQLPGLQEYPPMAGLVAQYQAAFAPMRAGAAALVAALDAGDANGIVAGTQQITNGMTVYGALRQQLSDWVDQLPDQQHFPLR